MNPTTESLPLPKDFALEGYRIERQISEGGFSFVYLARDAAGEQVAIKEYLPARLAHRLEGSPAPVIPEENRTDVENLPDYMRDRLTLVYVSEIGQALEAALVPPGE